jgi:hypothetical protein
MEVEAKITNQEVKQKLWIFEWDRTKYRILGKRVRGIVLVVFAFFLGYTLVTVMNQGQATAKSSTVVSTFDILPAQEVVSREPARDATQIPRKAVAKGPTYTGPQVIHREIAGIPPGTLVKARLVTGASDGPVRAKLLQDVSVQGEILIESGGILLGQGTSTEERLFIRFDRMVKKDGTTLQIQAQAIDQGDRIAGLRGNKVSTELAKLGAGIGLNFVGGMSEALQETEVKGGVAVKSNSFKNALLNGATYAALDQSKEVISSYKEKAPRIEVEKGKIIYVMTE